MRCEYIDNEKKCHNKVIINEDYCHIHLNTLQAREKNTRIVKINNMFFLFLKGVAVGFLDGTKIAPLRDIHIELIENAGYEVEKNIKEKLI